MADVETIADELYRLPPEEFIAARDQHARDLSKAKEREAAKAVKALRRPTVPAWALNQLRWDAADQLDEFFALTDELRTAQEAAIRDPEGGRDDLRDVIKRHRGLVQKLADAAVGVLRQGDRDPAQHRAPIETTLRATTGDEATAEAVRQGRLTTTADAPGFGEVPLDWTPPERTATPIRSTRKPATKKKAPARAKATKKAETEPEEPSSSKVIPLSAEERRARAAAQQRLRDVERQLTRARRRLEAAEEEHMAAAAEVERLETEHADAAAAVE